MTLIRWNTLPLPRVYSSKLLDKKTGSWFSHQFHHRNILLFFSVFWNYDIQQVLRRIIQLNIWKFSEKLTFPSGYVRTIVSYRKISTKETTCNYWNLTIKWCGIAAGNSKIMKRTSSNLRIFWLDSSPSCTCATVRVRSRACMAGNHTDIRTYNLSLHHTCKLPGPRSSCALSAFCHFRRWQNPSLYVPELGSTDMRKEEDRKIGLMG